MRGPARLLLRERFGEVQIEDEWVRPGGGDGRRTSLSRIFPLYLVGGKLKSAQAKSLEEVPRGEGRIVDLDGKKLAVFRDDAGAVTALSPECTQMGCNVAWNPAEKSWDCPCHGGRFNTQGEVINGPPVTPLKKA